MDMPHAVGTAEGAARVDAAFAVVMPQGPRVPLIFASPHSGRAYPDTLLQATRLDLLTLRRSEDSFLDGLFGTAPDHGAPLIHALFPRVWCDVNREAWELDQAMFQDRLPTWVNMRSPRVAAGLGTIARVVATGEPIYRRRLTFAEAALRIDGCWQPFHAALAGLIEETRQMFGHVVLIDCHSMPSVQAHEGRMARMPDFVLGDAHGTSCAAGLTRQVESLLAEMGYSVQRNEPYAGGYITRHYGVPRNGVHVLQLEISRALYMDEHRVERSPAYVQLAASLDGLVARLARADWPDLIGGKEAGS